MHHRQVHLLYEVPKVTGLPHLQNIPFSGLGKTSDVDIRNDVTFTKRCKEQTSAQRPRNIGAFCYCGSGASDMIEL